MKLLVCTLGKEDTTIYHALRVHKYDKLVLITEQDAVNTLEYKRILSLEGRGQYPLETIKVNSIDFWDCYNKVQKYLQKSQKDGSEIILNISGGTKLLSMASILCAFNLGIEAYHYEADRLTPLPVIRDLSIIDRISKNQILILKKVKKGDTLGTIVSRIESKDLSEETIGREVRILINKGLIRKEVRDRSIRLYLTDTGKKIRDFI